jgi:hypothetical protein
VKDIEWEILCGYSAAIKKVCNKHRPSDASMSQDDIYSEAIKSAITSIYHFTKEDVKFITFLIHCVNRHLTYKIGSLSRLSKRAYDLILNYEKIKNELNGSCNFEYVVEQMDLSDKEINILKNVLSKTYSFSDLDINESNILSKTNVDYDQFQIKEIISKLELNSLERAVLSGFLFSKSNGKTSLGIGAFAKNIINPVTGKPYSRQALTLIWKKIKNKIKNNFKAA